MSRSNVSTILAVLTALVGWLLFAMEARQQDDLEAALAAARTESAGAAQRAGESDANLELARERIRQLEADAGQLRDEVASLAEDKQSLGARVAEGEAVAATLEQQASRSDAKVAELETRVARALSAEQNLENEFAALATRSRRMQEHLEGLLGRQLESIGTLERDRRDMQEQLRRAMTEMQELQRERDTLTARLAAATAALEDAEQASTQAVSGEIEELRQAYTRLSDEHEGLKARLVSEQEQRSGVRSELDAERERVAVSSTALETAIADRESLQAQLEEARSRAGLTAELEARLAESDREIAQRTETLRQERDRVATLETSMEQINQRSEELVAKLQAQQNLVARLNAERDQARDEMRRLQSELREVVQQKELEIREIRDRVTLIRMDSDIVFGLGSTRLSESGHRVLDSVAEFARRSPDRVVSLEGHTDSIPIGDERRQLFPSNWELSAARAASAARYLESRGVESDRLRIVGYGQHAPVADNDSEDGRRANRRLEIILAPPQPSDTIGTVQ